jgi:hypothetical protein
MYMMCMSSCEEMQHCIKITGEHDEQVAEPAGMTEPADVKKDILAAAASSKAQRNSWHPLACRLVSLAAQHSLVVDGYVGAHCAWHLVHQPNAHEVVTPPAQPHHRCTGKP